jgi:AP2-like factor, euAP2 lineage
LEQIKIPSNNSEDMIIIDFHDWNKVIIHPWSVYNQASVRCRIGACLMPLANYILDLPTSVLVDHKDRNFLNFSRSNLRQATRSQNAINKAKNDNIDSTSKYKGVYWNKEKKCWAAQIRKNYKRYHIGYFSTEDAAAMAYNKKALAFFGEFAVLNLVKEPKFTDFYEAIS